MVLGVLVTTIVHVGLEQVIIRLLLADFATYSLGLSWDTWYALHSVMAVLLLVAGLVGGYLVGVRWWQVVYGEKTSADSRP